MDSFEQQKRYKRAKQRVACIRGFYSHLLAYFIVIPILFWLNSRTTDFPWAFFPALGWGFGLLMHGMNAYGFNLFLGKDWEERKIRELMAREEENSILK